MRFIKSPSLGSKVILPKANRRDVLALGGAAAMLTACGDRSGGVGRNIFTAESQPDGYPSTEAIKAMGSYLREKSGGRIGVKLYQGGQLGSEGSTLEIAMFGGLDMTRTFMAALNNIAPLTKIFSLPFLFRSTEHQRRVIDSDIGDTIMQSLENFNLRGVAIYDTGGRGFYTTTRPIPDPSALDGQKIRVPNSDIFLDTIGSVAEAKQTLLDSGGEILTDINSQPFRDRMAPVYEKYVTPELQPFLTKIDELAEA